MILYLIFWFLKDLVIIFSPIVTSPLGQDANLFLIGQPLHFFYYGFHFTKIIFTKTEQNFLNIFYLVFYSFFINNISEKIYI